MECGPIVVGYGGGRGTGALQCELTVALGGFHYNVITTLRLHEVCPREHFSGRPNRTKMHVGKVES